MTVKKEFQDVQSTIKNIKNINFLTESYSGNLIFCRVRLHRDNLGDAIITGLLIDKLRSYGRLIVSSQSPPNLKDDEVELLENESVDKYDRSFNYLLLLAGLKALVSRNKIKVYLIESPGHRFGNQSLLQSKNHILEVIHHSIFKALGIKICTCGTSIGPFSKTLEILENLRAKMMYFYSVRDSLSKDYAQHLGISKVVNFPDMAWFLEASPGQVNFPIKTHENLSQSIQDLKNIDEKYVIFSFREATHGLSNDSEYQHKLFQVLDRIVELIGGEWSRKVLLTYQVSSDYQFCQIIYQKYKEKCNIEILEQKVNSASLFEVYSRASLVFTNRLHVFMFSMACGALPIATIDAAKHDKITGILKDSHLQKLILDLHKGADEAEESVRQIVAQSEQVKADIIRAYDRNQSSGNTLFNDVMTGAFEPSD